MGGVISFIVSNLLDEYSFNAIEGMSWGDFIKSDYNIDGLFQFNDKGMVIFTISAYAGNKIKSLYTGEYQYLSDIISDDPWLEFETW